MKLTKRKLKEIIREELNEAYGSEDHARAVMSLDDSIYDFLKSNAWKEIVKFDGVASDDWNEKKIKRIVKTLAPLLKRTNQLLSILYKEIL